MKARIAVLLLLAVAATCHAATWTKYVAPDNSYSFHYPTEWKVVAQGSTVAIDCAKTGEQLLLVVAGVAEGQSAQDVAQKLVDGLKQGVPDLKVVQWSDLPQDGKTAAASISYSQDSKPFIGDMVVLLTKSAALWFEYSVPEADFSIARAQALLGAFMGSFAGGDGSAEPTTKIPGLATALLDRDASAFIFVLEFGCGTPLSEADEKTVREQVVKDWRKLSASQRAKQDAWPVSMNKILGLNDADRDKVQAAVAKLTRDALAKADSSPAVKVLRDAIASSSKIAADGNPPLTQSALDCYAELVAFASLFADHPKAGPEDIDPKTVARVKPGLVQVWPTCTADDRKTVLRAPAIWMSMRMTFQQGTAAEKEQARRSLSSMILYHGPNLPSSGSSSSSSNGKPMDWATFNCLQAMKQTTFNTYMWSQHYSGWTPMGKTW